MKNIVIPEYNYQVHDNSLLTPAFKKWLVAPLFRFIPWWIPANIITILSNMLMYIALYMALTECSADRSIRVVLIALLILGFNIGDHFDGMQAKRTGTSSALGELCDHYLDIFNNGILVYIFCLVFHITNPILVAFFIAASYLPHAATFYEQFSTKWLHFEKIGSLEALLLLPACIMVSAYEPVYRFALMSPLGVLTVAEILLILSSPGTFITFAKAIQRAKIIGAGFWTFCIFLTAVACMAMTFLSATAIFYVITAYSGLYIGNLQRGHLADGKKRIPDIIVPLFMAVAFVFEPLRQPIFLWGMYIYLACRTLWIVGNAFWLLRGFWVWKNN
jgi:ethanolaminephosphotransferase